MMHETLSPSAGTTTATEEVLNLEVEAYVRTPWHTLTTARAIELSGGSEVLGLSEEDVAQRLLVFGPNAIINRERFVWLKRLWRQINNILIYILLVAMIVSFVLGKYTDGAVIAGVLVINIAVGMVMEGRAEKASEAIRRMLPTTCVVRRNGRQSIIQAVDLVPGDVVMLNSGDKVSADMRLLKCSNFKTQEAVLTGESVPVEKHTMPVDLIAPLGDRLCIVFSGTIVAAGSAMGLVISTGERTEVGKINKMVQEVKNQGTPLLHKIEMFGRILSIAILGLAAIAFTILAVRSTQRGVPTNEALADAFTVAVSMAVAAVPEGLPAIVTVVLSRAVRIMAKKNAIVRQLAAVETLGSVTTICSDKTGTLTKNEMTVVAAATPASEYRVEGTGYQPNGAVYTVTRLDESSDAAAGATVASAASADNAALSDDEDDEAEALSPELTTVTQLGVGSTLDAPIAPERTYVSVDDGLLYRHLARCCVLCNDAEIHGKDDRWELVGDPTEGALVAFANKLKVSVSELRESVPRSEVVPFESTHRFMATLHFDLDGVSQEGLVYVKGAPEAILGLCKSQLRATAQDDHARDPLNREHWATTAERMARLGLRTIGLAFARVPASSNVTLSVTNVANLEVCFLGVVGIVDPPRPEAIAAVSDCHRAGVVVKMITGDHPETAKAIAGQLHIPNERVLTGTQVSEMDDEQLRQHVLDVCVFARSSPENKIRIVKALQDVGQVVSMTGDGVNDAPSLRQADVGVAMGITGTESAKESSKIVLADDNFATIAEAIREGRVVFDNLRKTLLFVLPTNVGQTLVIFLAVIADRVLPISATQVLWINMITSITLGVALAFESEEGNVMARKPRKPGKSLWERLLIWRMLFVGFLLGGLSLQMFEWELQFHQNVVNTAQAATVTVFAVGQVFYLLSARFLSKPSFSMRMFRKRNNVLWGCIVVMAILQVLFVYAPFMRVVFGTDGPVAMQGLAWLRAIAFGVFIFFMVEGEKFARRYYRRYRAKQRAVAAEAAAKDLEMASTTVQQ